MATTEKKETKAEIKEEGEKRVSIRLPFTPGKKKTEVVWVNDVRYEIKRGETVSVPESVVAILDEKDRLVEKSFRYEEANKK